MQCAVVLKTPGQRLIAYGIYLPSDSLGIWGSDDCSIATQSLVEPNSIVRAHRGTLEAPFCSLDPTAPCPHVLAFLMSGFQSSGVVCG